MTDHPIMRLTERGRGALLDLLDQQPDLWRNPHTDFHQEMLNLGVPDYAETTGYGTPDPITLSAMPGVADNHPSYLDRQAVDFARNLANLPLKATTDFNIWEWMTHFRLHAYSCRRWPNPRHDFARHTKIHWFVFNSTDDLYQNNTASRTFWVGKTAIDVAAHSTNDTDAHNVARFFSEKPVIYHGVYRSSFSHNPRTLAPIIQAFLQEHRGLGINGRGAIELWKRLNLDFGRSLPEAIPVHQLDQRIDQHLNEIMAQPDYVSSRHHLRNPKRYKVLSFGGGAQSTGLALMADRGAHGLEPPDIAIFADTGWEPPEVYEHIEWVRNQIQNFKIITVSAGNIRDNLLNATMPNGSTYLGLPFFQKNPSGKKTMMHRQCTTEYKLKPIHREIRKILNLSPRSPVPKDTIVEMWVGISTDERQRVKDSKEEWIEKKYPLLDKGLSRAQIHRWFQNNYPGRELPKSSCIGCPFHSDAIWADMKQNDPSSFLQAVEIDLALRQNPKIVALTDQSPAFIHPSLEPLALVDFSRAVPYQDTMNAECEGLCEF